MICSPTLLEEGKRNDIKDEEADSSNRCLSHLKTMALRTRDSLANTKFLVHILVCVFAIASWADLNGMWVELPLLVLKAKEGWTLPSYMSIISQVANIGPLLFVTISYLAPHTKPRLEKVTSFLIILVSTVASLLLAFFWQHTTYVGGVEHSTALLTLNFFLAFGDTTSSVSFYAFMHLLKPQYMASLFIGEGLSGLLPAMIALAQGAGDIECVNVSSQVNKTYPNGTEYNETVYNIYPQYVEPLFSVKIYFIILAAIITVSALAFLLLNFWGYCKSEFVDQKNEDEQKIMSSCKGGLVGHSYGSLDSQSCINKEHQQNVIYQKQERYVKGTDTGHVGPYTDKEEEEKDDAEGNCSSNPHEEDKLNTEISTSEQHESFLSQSLKTFFRVHNIPLSKFLVLLLILVLINMTLTTFLSSIQVYSVLPYGLGSYHLTTTLSQIANPMACFFALFVMSKHVAVIVVVTALGEACAAYIIYLAAMSPEPPLHGETAGRAIAVTLWIFVTLLLVYAKVCVAGVLRTYGRHALIWAGVATQFGCLVGAIVGFVLVNEYHVFKDAPYC